LEVEEVEEEVEDRGIEEGETEEAGSLSEPQVGGSSIENGLRSSPGESGKEVESRCSIKET
jgi:hypothetical protein